MFNTKGAWADGAGDEPFFGLFYWANGLPWHEKHGAQQVGHPDLWTPAQVGANYTPTELLMPLSRHDVIVMGKRPFH